MLQLRLSFRGCPVSAEGTGSQQRAVTRTGPPAVRDEEQVTVAALARRMGLAVTRNNRRARHRRDSRTDPARRAYRRRALASIACATMFLGGPVSQIAGFRGGADGADRAVSPARSVAPPSTSIVRPAAPGVVRGATSGLPVTTDHWSDSLERSRAVPAAPIPSVTATTTGAPRPAEPADRGPASVPRSAAADVRERMSEWFQSPQ